MFVTDRFIYIQLQKTGSSHITKLMAKTVGGVQRGKHKAATSELFNNSRIFISSIRNPWEWYVSLWSYGCENKGGFRYRVTQPHHHLKENEMGSPPVLSNRSSHHADQWLACYTNADDTVAFRQWLYLVFDEKYRCDYGEGYGQSSVWPWIGIYTFRYLKLCCRNSPKFNSIGSTAHLIKYEQENCYISKWIRNESLEQDFIDIVLGENANRSSKKQIFTHLKTNTSTRSKPIYDYYDTDTESLVRKKEFIIIDKFGYSFPRK